MSETDFEILNSSEGDVILLRYTGSDETVVYGENDEDGDDGGTVAKSKKFTFTLKGDFSDEWKAIGSRAYLAADGKDLSAMSLAEMDRYWEEIKAEEE